MTLAIVNGVLTQIPRFPSLRLVDPCEGWVTQAFGSRSITGIIHRGRDKANVRRTEIRAMAAGVVISTRTDSWRWVGPLPPGYKGVDTSKGGYGNNVVIDHGAYVDEAGARHQVTTMYGHLEVVFVSPGQRVEAGQLIALMGSTGISTGDHCHHEARRGADPFDAAEYMTAEEDELAGFTDEEKAALHELARREDALTTIADHKTGGGVAFADALGSLLYFGPGEGRDRILALAAGTVPTHLHDYASSFHDHPMPAHSHPVPEDLTAALARLATLEEDTELWRAVETSIKALGEERGRKAATAMLVRLIRDNAIAAPNLDVTGAWIARWMYVDGKPPHAPGQQDALVRGGVVGEGVTRFDV